MKYTKHRFIWILFIALIIICLNIALIIPAFAYIYNGGGDPGSSGSSTTGSFNVPYSSYRDIVGYRFSIYDNTGAKAGHAIDIWLNGGQGAYSNYYSGRGYKSFGNDKRSHIDLKNGYSSSGTWLLPNLTIMSGFASGYDFLSTDAAFNTSTSLTYNPTACLETWIDNNKTKLFVLCLNNQPYDTTTSVHIIVEPLLEARLGDKNYSYAFTVAEYAVYQANQCGYNNIPVWNNNYENMFLNIVHYTSQTFPTFLRAAGEIAYPNNFPLIVNISYQAKANGDLYVANDTNPAGANRWVGPLAHANGDLRRNSAKDVLDFCTGMAIYTKNGHDVIYTITYNANGGSNAPNEQHKFAGVPIALSNGRPNRANYTFLGWSESSTATIQDDRYDPGDIYSENRNLNLYAVWQINNQPPVPTIKFTNGSTTTTVRGNITDDNGIAAYAWTTSGNEPSTWVTVPNGPTELNLSYTINTSNTWYLHVKDIHGEWNQANIKLQSLTLNKGTGITSVSPFTGTRYYTRNTTVTISSIVAIGYTWDSWIGTSTLTSRMSNVVLDSNKSYTARAKNNAPQAVITFTNGSTLNNVTCTGTDDSGIVYYAWKSGSAAEPTDEEWIPCNTTTSLNAGQFTCKTGTTYYFWVKDAIGAKGSAFITLQSLTLNKGTGITSVSPFTGTRYYIRNARVAAKVTIDASVARGYTWDNWTGTSTLTNCSNVITVNNDKTYTAHAHNDPPKAEILFDINKNELKITGHGTDDKGIEYYAWTENTNMQPSNWKPCPALPQDIEMPKDIVTGVWYNFWVKDQAGEVANAGTIKIDGSEYDATFYTLTVNHDIGITSTSPAVGTYVRPEGYSMNVSIKSEDVKTGYIWMGWTGFQSTMNYGFDVTLYQNREYTATTRPIEYDIHYDGNDATGGSTPDSHHYYDAEQPLTENGYERQYLVTYIYDILYNNGTYKPDEQTHVPATFNGWAETADGAVVYHDKEVVVNLATEDGDVITLYANWTLNSVTLPAPTQPGYNFDGWYNDKDGDGQLEEDEKMGDGGDAFTPTEDTELEAKWTPKDDTPYIVRYYKQKNYGVNEYVLYEQYSLTGTTDTSVTITPKTYYGFTGVKTEYATRNDHLAREEFSTDGTISVTVNVFGDGSTYVNYYYNRNPVTLTYVLNGGEVDGSTANIIQHHYYGDTVTLITPTYYGYLFEGWYLQADNPETATVWSSGFVGNADDDYVITEDTTLYAYWIHDPDIVDLGIYANEIYGEVMSGKNMCASATVLNHSHEHIKNDLPAVVTLSVTDKNNRVVFAGNTTIVIPAKNKNLVSMEVTLPNDIEAGSTLTYKWTISVNPNSTMVDDVPDDNVSTRTAKSFVYHDESQTQIPNYQLDRDPLFNENLTGEDTKLNTFTWQTWEYADGLYTKHTYKSLPDYDDYDVSLILTPENINGLKTPSETGYVTRSGYGFSVDSSVVLSKDVKVGVLRAYMLFPEFNYSTADKQFEDLLVTTKAEEELTKYVLKFRNNINGDARHYTPMWYPDGWYNSVTKITGMWTPIGEVRYTIAQKSLNELAPVYDVKANNLLIDGSLFDDMYTTHDRYTDNNAD